MRKVLFASICVFAGFVLAVLVLGLPPTVRAGGGAPPCSSKNGDVNGNGEVDLSDAVTILNFLFLGNPTELVPLCATLQPFRDNGNGTVTDTTTGLMWQQETAPGTYTLEGAFAYCNNLQLGGHDNWRLPEVWELFSIVDPKHTPTIDPIFGALSSVYWSSTFNADARIYAWGVHFGVGGVFYDGIVDRYGIDGDYFVRAVRTAP